MSNSVTNILQRTLLASAALHSYPDSWKSNSVETIQCKCPKASWKMPNRTSQKRSRSWFSCTKFLGEVGSLLDLLKEREQSPACSPWSCIAQLSARERSCFASSSTCAGKEQQEPCTLAVLGTWDHSSLQKSEGKQNNFIQ